MYRLPLPAKEGQPFFCARNPDLRRPMKPKLLATALLITLTAAQSFGQGALTPPPGPPAPTMKTLDQIEPRTIVNAANTPGDATNTFIISAPGSYYFAGNITGEAGKHGISIQANDVTLDLSGFALVSGGGGAFRGVNIPAVQNGFTIRNGTVRGWTDGGVRTDFATSTLAEKLRLINNTGAWGLAVAGGSARDCVASGNGTGFVLGNGARISDCAATGNVTGFFLSDRSHASNCISTINTGVGFDCTSFVTLIDCTASRNSQSGIVALASCSIIRCTATRNLPFGYGILAGPGCTVADCTVGANGLNGIQVETGSTVRGCTSRANSSRGIAALGGDCFITGNNCTLNDSGIIVDSLSLFGVSGNRNRIEDNTCNANSSHGFLINGFKNFVIRNNASGNGTAYAIPAGNAAGPVIDMSAGGTITSTNPWANFIH